MAADTVLSGAAVFKPSRLPDRLGTSEARGMKRRSTLAVLIVGGVILAHVTPHAIGPGQVPSKLFVFDDPFWLNLHQFLYVLGRAEADTPDSRRRAVAAAPDDQAEGLGALDEGEQRAWRAAVATYAKGPSRRDVVFDGDMVSLGRTLIAAGDRMALDSKDIDPPIVDALRRAAAGRAGLCVEATGFERSSAKLGSFCDTVFTPVSRLFQRPVRALERVPDRVAERVRVLVRDRVSVR